VEEQGCSKKVLNEFSSNIGRYCSFHAQRSTHSRLHMRPTGKADLRYYCLVNTAKMVSCPSIRTTHNACRFSPGLLDAYEFPRKRRALNIPIIRDNAWACERAWKKTGNNVVRHWIWLCAVPTYIPFSWNARRTSETKIGVAVLRMKRMYNFSA
jgi:hypothetical protein